MIPLGSGGAMLNLNNLKQESSSNSNSNSKDDEKDAEKKH